MTPVLLALALLFQADEKADLVLRNGVFFRSEAVAVRGGKILATKDVAKFVGPNTKVVDLQGKFVCPGFNDSHIHFAGGGASLLRLNLAGLSLAEIQAAVAEAVKKARPGEWVYGRGWDHTRWPGEKVPTRQDLDSVTGDVPVVLTRIDGHIVWANSKALALSGVSAASRAPPGGEIDRIGDEPSGILRESAAGLLKRGPAAAVGKQGTALEAALEEARRLGITSIQTGGESIEPYFRMYDAGKLTVRACVWGELGGNVARYAELRTKTAEHPQVRQGCLKGFADGTLGSGTAAMFEPYADEPSKTGLLQWTPQQLNAAVIAADKAGLQVAIHAIGDRGIAMTLDAFEAARKANGARDSRHRVEHIQIIRLQDVPRFKELGVIASVQPCHATNDQRWAEKRAGRKRCEEGGYLWKTFVDAAVPLAFGTDWPVEPADPLANLYAAVTRQQLDGAPEGGWFPKERLTIEQAIDACTIGAAAAEFAEKEKGSIEPGKWADLVVLDTNLLKATPKQILAAKVVATIFNGQVVYGTLE
ncbi:MAG: amidohydrolase [Planctomycetes bacterium]|nr:amidohydrolase [Planctomycetota bacterium]